MLSFLNFDKSLSLSFVRSWELIRNLDFSDLSKSSIVPIIFSKVVLPAPEGPTIEINSPFLIFKEILSKIF